MELLSALAHVCIVPSDWRTAQHRVRRRKRRTGLRLDLCEDLCMFKLTSYNGYHFLHTYCTCSAAPIV